MMPWWSWLIIWVVLVLALLAMLALMAFRLFRKGVGVLTELETLASKMELLQSESDALDKQKEQLAILAGAAYTRERRARVRAAALERRAARHDARIARAKALTKVDASTREWFKAR
jgi:peptidoglycan hydrolase CwlO-like protein